MAEEPRLYTVKQLSEYLGVSNSTVLRMIKRGEINFGFKLGQYWRFKVSDVEAWVETCKQPQGRSGPAEKPLPRELNTAIAVEFPKVSEQGTLSSS